MTLDLKRQNRGFYGFFGDFGLWHESVSFTRWSHGTIIMCTSAFRYFIPNSRKSNSNSDRNFCCTISLYCERNNLLFSTFLMHSIWWNGLHTLIFWYFVIFYFDILFDGAVTSGISLQPAALTNPDWLHWLTCYIFMRESSYCFHRVLAIAILFVCLSVRPSITWVDQSKAVQARITKFSPSAARNYRYAIQVESLLFWQILYTSINLVWTPQFSANILNWNCYRLSRISWALAQISCLKYQCPTVQFVHQTVKKIEKMGWELLQHLPYSPDLALSNFYLFGLQSENLETLSSRMMKMFYSIVSENFYRCQQKLNAVGSGRLIEQWEHCSELQGEYVDK